MSNAILHVRFAANGSVIEISERPAALTPQDWFNFLSLEVPSTYQALAGGRGVFRIPTDALPALKASAAPAAA